MILLMKRLFEAYIKTLQRISTSFEYFILLIEDQANKSYLYNNIRFTCLKHFSYKEDICKVKICFKVLIEAPATRLIKKTLIPANCQYL